MDLIIFSLTFPKLFFHVPTLVLMLLPEFHPGICFPLNWKIYLSNVILLQCIKTNHVLSRIWHSVTIKPNLSLKNYGPWGKNYALCLCIFSFPHFLEGICPIREIKEKCWIQIWFYPELPGQRLGKLPNSFFSVMLVSLCPKIRL